MATRNTGYQRATLLTIIVVRGSAVISTNDFHLGENFTYNGTAYPALTDAEIALMSLTDYNARATAYAAYVQQNYQSQYPGLTVSSSGTRVYNTTACPLP